MKYKKYKRIFLIVMDSLGIGALDDAKKYNDEGTNTFVHISEKCNGLNIQTLNALGLYDLNNSIIGTSKVIHQNSIVCNALEASNGKDTMTGHWEMMGIYTENPFKTFTETGFPKELIDELSRLTERKIIGNYSASGTEIIKELGEEQTRDGSLIVYTSADSVLQIAANVEHIPLKDLYSYCEIARELCMKDEYKVGRVIARPYIGTNSSNFKRTSDRHDYALSPSKKTYMNLLSEKGYEVSCIGKINDIFNGYGVTRTQKTVSNDDGMIKTINETKIDFTGLCFVNLVEFDSEYGHRRNPLGYGKAIEEFDVRLKELIDNLNDDDLLLVTADHGNDPTHLGTDHTRERVPFICYSKSIKDGRRINDLTSFADMGRSIAYNFNIDKDDSLIGEVIKELF